MGIFSLIKPLKKYEDYVYKAGTYENWILKRKAIKMMSLATEQNFSKEEIWSNLSGVVVFLIKRISKVIRLL